LARHPHRAVRLEAGALRNVNHPHELPPPAGRGSP
jgi:hypothetical protein